MIYYHLNESLTEGEIEKLYSQELIYSKYSSGIPELDAINEGTAAMKFTSFQFNPN